jgi:hypothetical protein
MTIGIELKTLFPVIRNFVIASFQAFPRSGVTSLSRKHVKTIVSIMYKLMTKLKNEEYLRELSVLGRDKGNTKMNYKPSVGFEITVNVKDQKRRPPSDV